MPNQTRSAAHQRKQHAKARWRRIEEEIKRGSKQPKTLQPETPQTRAPEISINDSIMGQGIAKQLTPEQREQLKAHLRKFLKDPQPTSRKAIHKIEKAVIVFQDTLYIQSYDLALPLWLYFAALNMLGELQDFIKDPTPIFDFYAALEDAQIFEYLSTLPYEMFIILFKFHLQKPLSSLKSIANISLIAQSSRDNMITGQEPILPSTRQRILTHVFNLKCSQKLLKDQSRICLFSSKLSQELLQHFGLDPTAPEYQSHFFNKKIFQPMRHHINDAVAKETLNFIKTIDEMKIESFDTCLSNSFNKLKVTLKVTLKVILEVTLEEKLHTLGYDARQVTDDDGYNKLKVTLEEQFHTLGYDARQVTDDDGYISGSETSKDSISDLQIEIPDGHSPMALAIAASLETITLSEYKRMIEEEKQIRLAKAASLETTTLSEDKIMELAIAASLETTTLSEDKMILEEDEQIRLAIAASLKDSPPDGAGCSYAETRPSPQLPAASTPTRQGGNPGKRPMSRS